MKEVSFEKIKKEIENGMEKVIELSGTRFFCRKSFQARALALEEIKPERTYTQENSNRMIYEYILTPKLVDVLNACARGEVKYILVK